jgi:hypothetical protein
MGEQAGDRVREPIAERPQGNFNCRLYDWAVSHGLDPDTVISGRVEVMSEIDALMQISKVFTDGRINENKMDRDSILQAHAEGIYDLGIDAERPMDNVDIVKYKLYKRYLTRISAILQKTEGTEQFREFAAICGGHEKMAP